MINPESHHSVPHYDGIALLLNWTPFIRSAYGNYIIIII